jgi:hypothetical protein
MTGFEKRGTRTKKQSLLLSDTFRKSISRIQLPVSENRVFLDLFLHFFGKSHNVGENLNYYNNIAFASKLMNLKYTEFFMKDDALYSFSQLNSKQLVLFHPFFVFEFYKDNYNKYSFSAIDDKKYQDYMFLRENLLRPNYWYLKPKDHFFKMKIKNEVALGFNDTQLFFNKKIFEYFLNPLFNFFHIGQISEIYDPTAEILREYGVETLEFSDISPFDADQMVMSLTLQKKIPTRELWYHYIPIEISYSSTRNFSYRSLLAYPFLLSHPIYLATSMATTKKYFFYDPSIFNFLIPNFEYFFSVEELFITKKDLYQHYTHSLNIFSMPFDKFIKHNIYVFFNRFYRYFALFLYDPLMKENDPFLSHYKLLRKNQLPFSDYKKILFFPIYETKEKE